MNRKQLSYQIGKITNGHKCYLAAASLPLTISLHRFSQSKHIGDMPFMTGIALSFPALVMLFKYCIKPSWYSFCVRHELKNHLLSNDYPLESAESVIIDDTAGLEKLLKKTEEKMPVEWGTLLKAYNDKEKCVIYQILDFEDAKNSGFVDYGNKAKLQFKKNLKEMEEYQGVHHYHPYDTASNFAINQVDRRVSPLNWINLLTFNLSGKPEIVAFNKRFTYVPKDSSKNVLVKADSKKIMDYLSV